MLPVLSLYFDITLGARAEEKRAVKGREIVREIERVWEIEGGIDREREHKKEERERV